MTGDVRWNNCAVMESEIEEKSVNDVAIIDIIQKLTNRA